MIHTLHLQSDYSIEDLKKFEKLYELMNEDGSLNDLVKEIIKTLTTSINGKYYTMHNPQNDLSDENEIEYRRHIFVPEKTDHKMDCAYHVDSDPRLEEKVMNFLNEHSYWTLDHIVDYVFRSLAISSIDDIRLPLNLVESSELNQMVTEYRLRKLAESKMVKKD